MRITSDADARVMTWRRWAVAAGVAWLVGFAQYVAVSLFLGIELASASVGFFVYPLLALLVGVTLLWRPTRAVLLVSISAAAAILVISVSTLGFPSLSPPDWLSWLPVAAAGVASVIALIVGRNLGSPTSNAHSGSTV